MATLLKKLSKTKNDLINVLVIGKGIGGLEEIIEIFQSVFVIASTRPEIKARNLIYYENFNFISHLSGISFIIFDRNSLESLNKTIAVWSSCKPLIIIEGEDIVERPTADILYHFGYRPWERNKKYHIWKSKT